MHSLTLGDGITQVVRRVAQYIDRDKFDLSVCCLAERGDLAEECERAGTRVHFVEARSSISPAHWIPNIYAVFKLAGLLKRERVDIVHTHEFFSGTLGRLAGILAGVPVIVLSLHSTDIWKGKAHILVDRFLAGRTDKIVTNSEAVKDFAVKYEGIPAEKFAVIYNGIDLSRFDEIGDGDRLRRELGLGPQDMVVGTVGRLAAEKGFEYLVKAAAIIRSQRPDVKFLIVGGDAHQSESVKDELYRLVERLKLEDTIIFTGLRSDLPAVLATLDVFVLPSALREGFGLAIAEAMAMRKPVIATRLGGIPEVVVDGVTGKLVPPCDEMALTGEILRLLDNPEMRLRMGAAGRQVVEEKFTAVILGRRMASLYESLAEQKLVARRRRRGEQYSES